MKRRSPGSSVLEMFASKISVTENCWVWMGLRSIGGYGYFRAFGKTIYAHRFSYEIHIGIVPEGKELDHLCRVRHCVNPWHLEIVTHRENVLRGTSPMAKFAQRKSCNKGHEYTPENTYWNKQKNNRPHTRDCRSCRIERQKAIRRNRMEIKNEKENFA